MEAPQTLLLHVHVFLYGMTFAFILTADLMLIFGFYKTSRPFTIITKLFICLSICEITLLSLYLINAIVLEVIGSMARYHFIILYALVYLIFVTGLLIFWTISFLRFQSIYKPMYRIKTRTVYKILLLEFTVTVLAASGLSCGYALWIPNLDELTRVNSKVVLSLNLVITLINVCLNGTSLIILRKSTILKANLKRNVIVYQMMFKRKKRAINTLLLVTTVQFVCTLPATCMAFLELETLLKNEYKIILVAGHCLKLSTFGFESLIIILRSKSLRQFYKSKFCFRQMSETPDNRSAIELSMN